MTNLNRRAAIIGAAISTSALAVSAISLVPAEMLKLEPEIEKVQGPWLGSTPDEHVSFHLLDSQVWTRVALGRGRSLF